MAVDKNQDPQKPLDVSTPVEQTTTASTASTTTPVVTELVDNSSTTKPDAISTTVEPKHDSKTEVKDVKAPATSATPVVAAVTTEKLEDAKEDLTHVEPDTKDKTVVTSPATPVVAAVTTEKLEDAKKDLTPVETDTKDKTVVTPPATPAATTILPAKTPVSTTPSAPTDKVAADKVAADKVAADKVAADKDWEIKIKDLQDKHKIFVKKVELIDAKIAVAKKDNKANELKILEENKDEITKKLNAVDLMLNTYPKIEDLRERLAKEEENNKHVNEVIALFKKTNIDVNILKDLADHKAAEVKAATEKATDEARIVEIKAQITTLEANLKTAQEVDKKGISDKIATLKAELLTLETKYKVSPSTTPTPPATTNPKTATTDADKGFFSNTGTSIYNTLMCKDKTWGALLQETAFIGVGTFGAMVLLRTAVGINVLPNFDPNGVAYQILSNSAVYGAAAFGVLTGTKMFNDNAGKIAATLATVTTCALSSYYLDNHVLSIIAGTAVVCNLAISSYEKGSLYEGFKQTVASTVGYSI